MAVLLMVAKRFQAVSHLLSADFKFNLAMVLLLILGVLIRLSLVGFSANWFDMKAWFILSSYMRSRPLYVYSVWDTHGAGQLYSYPPLWAYLLFLIGQVNRAIDWGDPAFVFSERTPVIVADVLTALLIYKIVLEWTRNKRASLVYGSLWLFSPLVIFAHTMMFDSIGALFLVLSIVLLNKGKLNLAAITLGLALSTKQYMLFPWLVTLAFILKKYNLQRCFVFGISSIMPLFLLSLPFLAVDSQNFITALTYSYPLDPLWWKGGFFEFTCAILIISNQQIPEWFYSDYRYFFYLTIPLPIFIVQRWANNFRNLINSNLFSLATFLVFSPLVGYQFYVPLLALLCLNGNLIWSLIFSVTMSVYALEGDWCPHPDWIRFLFKYAIFVNFPLTLVFWAKLLQNLVKINFLQNLAHSRLKLVKECLKLKHNQ